MGSMRGASTENACSDFHRYEGRHQRTLAPLGGSRVSRADRPLSALCGGTRAGRIIVRSSEAKRYFWRALRLA